MREGSPVRLLITIKEPFGVWASVVSAVSALVAKSSNNIVEAHITHKGAIPRGVNRMRVEGVSPSTRIRSHTSPSKPAAVDGVSIEVFR